MAKLSLPKLEFDKKKAGIAGGVLVLAVVGWFAWDMFMSEPSPPPVVTKVKPPAPKPPAQVPSDKPAEAAKAGEATLAEKPAAKAPVAPVIVAAAPAAKVAQADAGPRALTARSKLDARECLKFDTNQAIHRCAEGFR